MAAIDFPASPTTGQLFSAANGVTYIYNGTLWLTQAGPGGGTGEVTVIDRTLGNGLPINVDSVLPFNVVVAGNAGGWWNSSSFRYTPPAGKYFISCSYTFNLPAGAAGSVFLKLRKNGVVLDFPVFNTGSNSWAISNTLGIYVNASGTDYFDVVANPNINGMVTGGGAFSAFPLTGTTGPAGPSGTSITISDTPPGSPTAGIPWWNSVLGTLMIYYNDGTSSQWVPASPAATPGSLLQTVFTETGAVATGTTVIPLDNTIPQQTEGDQYMTLAITRMSATSKLIVNVIWFGANNVSNTVTVALFQDATANALAAVSTSIAAGAVVTIPLCHTMTSGTTGTTTFRVRAGGFSAGTTTFNASLYGGIAASSIVIQEVA